MKKVLDSFLNEHDENFDEFFDRHIVEKVKDREDYIATRQIKRELMNKYPNIMGIFDMDRIPGLSEEENEAYLDVIRAEIDRIKIERKEAFKLGFKEAYIFFEEQGMLNI